MAILSLFLGILLGVYSKNLGEDSFVQISIYLTYFLILFLAVYSRSILWLLFSAAVLFIYSNYGAPLWVDKFPLYPSISKAVSYSAFYGDAKISSMWAYYIALFLAGLLGVLSIRTTGGPISQSPIDVRGRKTFLMWTGVIGIFLTIPNYEVINKQLSSLDIVPYWDWQNLRFWEYLLVIGKKPFVDFSYPYSMMYNLFRISSQNYFFELILNVSFYLVYLTSIVFLLGQYWRRATTVLIWIVPFLLILVVRQKFWMDSPLRYGLGFSVILASVAVMSFRHVRPVVTMFYGFWVGSIFFLEMSQAIYSYPAVLLAALLLIWFTGRKQRSIVSSNLVFFAVGAGTVFCVGVLALLLNGQLSGLYDVLLSLAQFNDYTYRPTQFGGWFYPRPYAEFVLVTAGIMSIVLGFLVVRKARTSEQVTAGVLILATSFFSAMVSLKFVAKSSMGWQIWWIWPFVLMLACFMIVGKKSVFRRLSFFVSGIFLVYFYSVGEPLLDRSKNILTIGSLMDLRLDADSRFSFDIYPSRKDELKGVNSKLTAALRENAIQNYFVLGDESYFYFQSNGRAIPFNGTLWESGPLREQERIVKYLEESQIDLVIWNPLEAGYEIPHQVRTPVIFQYVSENFVPFQKHGVFEFLRRKTPTQYSDIFFWNRSLGPTDLGYLPALSSFKGHTNFDKDEVTYEGEGTRWFIEVTGANPNQKNNLVLSFKEHEFVLSWKALEKQHGLVDLSRLWFWSVIKNELNLMQIKADVGEARLVSKKDYPQMLY